MEVVAKTEMLDVYDVKRPEDAGPRIMLHPRDAIDGRGRLLIDLVKQWGYAAAFGVEMSMMTCEEHRPAEHVAREPLGDFVLRCAEVVDATYDELRRRSWMAIIPKSE
jgi:hypothetical protein